MADTNPNPSFPYDVIIDILSRLSVKPLLKFRSVSKSWLALISSPHFIKLHLSRSTHHNLIFQTLWGKGYFKSCSLYSLTNQSSSEVIHLDYIRENHVKIVGSCNGLVCLLIGGQHLCLWNPSTSKLRYVDSHNDGRQFICGFGYDEHNDDYKLVKMFLNYSDTACKTQVEIYSSKFDCWRQIEDFPFAEPLRSSTSYDAGKFTNGTYDAGKFTNGNLHWEGTLDFNSDDEPDSWIIASLDVEKETYGQVLQPNYGEGDYYLTLGILSGYLSVLCSYVESWADVWIMKEYGRKESWTKLVTIPLDDALDSWEVLVPLHISMNGDILLEFDGHKELYDSKDKKLRRIKFSKCYQLGIYTESLVSPITQSSA